ncbi:cysteine desulfurase [Mycolicibacterium phlei]|uniref:aminotransferase class V-fold PLP-dependent enzyme n=1 Tax=Mycobacteroides chelonae TaxID=1774 RepID=UPI000618C1B6|nr:aminotransferase class V-fold PLP-dependent enzyme [Mycobacteroides chelonae]VEG14620.1 cysteine desulfurase [Mycolicibacterium phlei]AKC37642.1 aminotransferase [Mycobacteroides chelonae]ANA96713.1 aminotransferase [Mycobacteroides chelonae CCUG 47445]OLT82866.1 aminotransferase [Mycobacteroides chelonae]ORV17778.1 aminotransferase [Mycobacteroides chelonae]
MSVSTQFGSERAAARVVGADVKVPLAQGGWIRYANFDYAASAPALGDVADRVNELLPYYASVHRGAGYASRVCTTVYEGARETVGRFVGAAPDHHVIFTRNTTDSLNLLASAVPGGADSESRRHPNVVVLDIEHHANLLTWQRYGARVVAHRATVADTVAALDEELARQPAALLAVTGASNVTGEVLPLAELAVVAHRHGARIAVDGAQLVPHRRIDLAATGIDYLAFSGHKLYAPFGAGVLVGQSDWLDAARPYLAGGGAVRNVGIDGAEWLVGPQRHEAGTPNVVGVAAVAAACEALAALGEIGRLEEALTAQLREGLDAIEGVDTLRIWEGGRDVLGIVSFTVDGYTPSVAAAYLSAEHGIGVRDGRFCAHPLLARLGAPGGALRASVGLGTTAGDITRLVDAIGQLVHHGLTLTYLERDGQVGPADDPRPLPDFLVA